VVLLPRNLRRTYHSVRKRSRERILDRRRTLPAQEARHDPIKRQPSRRRLRGNRDLFVSG